jgi:hypothetical protein
MRVALICVMLLAAGPVKGSEPWCSSACWSWSAANVALEASYAAAVVLDWRQTSEPGFKEAGVFRPLFADGQGRVDQTRMTAFMFGGAAIHAVISAILPRPYREVWQGVSLAVEAGNVARNFQVGARLVF